MDESKLSTIEQIDAFLGASEQVAFTAHEGDTERYAHISRVLRRFDYPRRNIRERGVLLAYLRHTSGHSRSQRTRLVWQWEGLDPQPPPKGRAREAGPNLRARPRAFSGRFLGRPMAFENPIPSFFARLNVHGRQGCAVEPRTTRSTSIVVTLAIG